MVLVDGAVVLHVEARSGKVVTFESAGPEAVTRALSRGLPQIAAAMRKSFVVESVDGEKSILSRWAKVMEQAGLRRDYKGHVVSASTAATAIATAATAAAATAAPAAATDDESDEDDEGDEDETDPDEIA